MRTYNVRVVWQNQGNGYERTQGVDVRASSVRTAINKAIQDVSGSSRRAGTWREATGGYFKIGVIVGARVIITKPAKNQDLTGGEVI